MPRLLHSSARRMPSSHHATKRRRLRALTALKPFLAPYRKRLLAAAVALLLAALSMLAIPVALRHVIDQAVTPSQDGAAAMQFALLLALAVSAGGLAALRFYLVSWLGERVVADLRSRVFGHLLHLPTEFYESTPSGELISRLTADTTLIQNVVGSSISIALRSTLTLCGALIMLAVTSLKLASIIVVLVPAVVLPIVFIGRRVRRLSRTTQDRVADTAALAGEVLHAISLVQAFNLEDVQRQRYDDAVDASFTAACGRMRQRAWLTAYAIVTVFSGLVAVLWLGVNEVVSGSMSSGQLGQFLLYALFVGGSTAGLSEIWGSIQQAAGAAERLVELLATPPLPAAPSGMRSLPARPRGELCFREIDFGYPSRAPDMALRDFSLDVAAGETVALVGASGAGKSTVFQLVLGFRQPSRGFISLDGVKINEMPLATLRSHLAVVPQQTVLFADTIRENIRMGSPGASDAAVLRAASAAGATAFIEALPLGFDTFVGEKGVRLSGGQQQRIAIARAALREPAVLLLDEATSALDAENQALVQTALSGLQINRTTLIIAHRLSTVRGADRIVLLDHGRIAGIGRHEDLLREHPGYARLAHLELEHADGSPARHYDTAAGGLL